MDFLKVLCLAPLNDGEVVTPTNVRRILDGIRIRGIKPGDAVEVHWFVLYPHNLWG